MKFESMHLAQGPQIKTSTIPGPKAESLLQQQDIFESNNRSYPRGLPFVPQKAMGTIVEDVDGNQFMDFFSLCGVVNLGHNQKEILDDVLLQMGNLIHAMDFPTEIKIEFLKNLNSKLPDNLKDKVKVNFCGPTGADAIEASLKVARINTKRNLVISFQGAYHGMTMGALSVTGNLKNRKNLPVNHDVQFAPYAYCYRCPFGKQPDSCRLECATYIRNMIENPHSGIDQPAAILIEPVQGEGGIVIPKSEFHRELRTICNDHSIVLIHDEVQAGFYRTGKLLSSEHFDVTPDVVAMSKGIGGVGLPIAVLLIKKEFDTWSPGTHAGTFRGNQLSIAGGNSALKFVERNAVQQHTTEMEKILMDGLAEVMKESKYIGDLRGIGLMFGIEYVKDKKTKEPFSEYCAKLRRRLFENGILIEIGGHYGNVVRVLPPLVTTKAMIETFVDIFRKVNRELDKAV